MPDDAPIVEPIGDNVPADDRTLTLPDTPPTDPAASPPPLPSTTTAEPVAAAPAAPAVPGLRERFTARGYDTSAFADDDAMFDEVLGKLETSNSEKELTDLGRQFAPYATDFPKFQEWQKQQQVATEPATSDDSASVAAATPAPAPADAVAEPPAFDWPDLPELDLRVVQACDRDSRTGLFRIAEGMPLMPGAAERLNEIQAQHTERAERLVTEFPDLVTGVMAQTIAELKAESAKLTAAMETSQARQDSLTYVQARGSEFYQHDEQGNQVVDPQTSQPTLSPIGEAQRMIVETLPQYDMGNPAHVRDLGEVILNLRKEAGHFTSPAAANGQGQATAAPAQAATGTPSQQAVALGEGKRQLFLERTVRAQQSPDRGGTIPDSTAPENVSQNADASFGEIIDDLVRNGPAVTSP